MEITWLWEWPLSESVVFFFLTLFFVIFVSVTPSQMYPRTNVEKVAAGRGIWGLTEDPEGPMNNIRRHFPLAKKAIYRQKEKQRPNLTPKSDNCPQRENWVFHVLTMNSAEEMVSEKDGQESSQGCTLWGWNVIRILATCGYIEWGGWQSSKIRGKKTVPVKSA